MPTATESNYTSPTLLKSPLFAFWKGMEAAIKNGLEIDFYLPTQLVDIEQNLIVAPSSVSLRLEDDGFALTKATGGLEQIVRNVAGVTVPLTLLREGASRAITGDGNGTLVPLSILLRGLAYAEEAAVERKEVEDLHALCDITWQELLEGKPGRAYIHFETRQREQKTIHAWDDYQSGKPYFRIGVVMECFPNGDYAAVKWLKENDGLISDECKVPKAPGVNFSDLPYPIGGLMRRLQGIASSSTKRTRTKENTMGFDRSFEQQMLEAAGEVFDANDWKPEFDARQSAYVNAVAVDEKTGLLLLVFKIDDGKRSWGTPGGGVEVGETTVEALVREVRWETSLNIGFLPYAEKLYGIDKIIDRLMNERHRRITFYTPFDSKSFRIPKRVKEDNEIGKVGLFTLGDCLKMPHFPYDRTTAKENENYIKQLHMDDIVTVLRKLGKLEPLGCREATPDEYENFVLAQTA
ncbi:MAG: NUDIX hydrolase [Patescibacteria group bacterium]